MKTWILVANAARARLFEAEENDGRLVERAAFEHPEARLHGAELTRDRGGSVQESASDMRHRIEPRQDPHDKVAVEFAHALADMLDQGRIDHDFERLILVAPPRFLGQLRDSLDEQVARLVSESLHKDASRATAEEIESMLHA